MEIEYNICEACGTKYDININECPECGFVKNIEFDEEVIEEQTKETENNEEDNEIEEYDYECDNCGALVKKIDIRCPKCGFIFEDNIILTIDNYLDELNIKFNKTLNEKFIGLKINETDKYYFLYIVIKDSEIELYYRTNINSLDKSLINITNVNEETIIEMINIIINFITSIKGQI